MNFEVFLNWLSNFSGNVAASVVGSVIFVILGLLIFNRKKLRNNLNRVRDFFRPKTGWRKLSPIKDKTEVGKLYQSIFLDVETIEKGELFLMSNTGGVPEFDPYPKILNICRTSRKGMVYIAVTEASFVEWSKNNLGTLRELIEQENLRIYLFDDLTPSHYRLGLNTNMSRGFLVYNFGNDGDQNHLEGFSSSDRLVLNSIRTQFHSLVDERHEFRNLVNKKILIEHKPEEQLLEIGKLNSEKDPFPK